MSEVKSPKLIYSLSRACKPARGSICDFFIVAAEFIDKTPIYGVCRVEVDKLVLQIGAWKLTGMVREMSKRLKYRYFSKGKQSNKGSYTHSSPVVRELASPQKNSDELTISVIGDSQKTTQRPVDEHVACFIWAGSALSKIIDKVGNLTTMKNHFGQHYSTINRIVSKENKCVSERPNPSLPLPTTPGLRWPFWFELESIPTIHYPKKTDKGLTQYRDVEFGINVVCASPNFMKHSS